MKKSLIPRVMVMMVAAASVLATAAITCAVLVRETRPAAEPLPIIFEVPPFTLTDQDGNPYGAEQLSGKVWVADFMFTRCSGVCPMLSTNMQALQAELQKDLHWRRDIRLVSLSVDTEHDTPAILKKYADRYGAEPGQWIFLTGQRKVVWPLIEDGFKLMVGEDPDNVAMPFAHSSKFALVDRHGRVRAYHDGATPQGRAALIADLQRLLQE